MKYMVTLAKQVTLIKDVPQVVILFQEQRDETLVFTLVMVRPRKGPSLAEVQAPFFIDIERIREAGYIRNRVVKEASLWRIELPQRTFLRRDGVVDLYKARQAIVLWLESWFGKIRDYNGGMIAKQQEVLDALSLLLPGEEDEVREFFYALSPAELRVVIPVEGLKEFYQMGVGVGAFGVYVDREIEGKEFLLLRLEGATACFFRSEGEKNRFLQLVEGGHSLV